MGLLQRYFLPTAYVESIEEITPQLLKDIGVKAVMTDLDNTLVAFDEPHADNKVVKWFNDLNEHNIKVMIVSNGKMNRVGKFSAPYDYKYICSARKPLSKNYKRAAAQMNVDIEDTVMVGDQLMTDILGANKINMKSILVIPVKDKDGMATFLNRRIEKKIMKYFMKHDLLKREE